MKLFCLSRLTLKGLQICCAFREEPGASLQPVKQLHKCDCRPACSQQNAVETLLSRPSRSEAAVKVAEDLYSNVTMAAVITKIKRI